MEEVEIVGLITKKNEMFALTTDDGKTYYLSAILPWEAVSADFNSGKFIPFLGKRVRARGLCNGSTIYKAALEE
ncbi:MAG: hypothetical protein JW779_06910 [Candidatus Thorarchaeota archaeon]|nr:hypothetical protein [Candidatus Thorarchaeota archaeon]